jgi:hypothetical protein
MLSSGFEPATPATKRPQTYALGSAATGISIFPKERIKFIATSEKSFSGN